MNLGFYKHGAKGTPAGYRGVRWWFPAALAVQFTKHRKEKLHPATRPPWAVAQSRMTKVAGAEAGQYVVFKVPLIDSSSIGGGGGVLVAQRPVFDSFRRTAGSRLISTTAQIQRKLDDGIFRSGENRPFLLPRCGEPTILGGWQLAVTSRIGIRAVYFIAPECLGGGLDIGAGS